MRIVYAPDSYGGFLSASAACRLVRKVLALRGLDIDPFPMADGGEGTREVLREHGVTGSLEVVESARWLGPNRPGMRGPWQRRSSAPLGLRLRQASGPLVVGLGGTATMDGGAGALQALGLVLRDASGRPLPPGVDAGCLSRVSRIQGRPPLWDTVVQLLADVESPLRRAPELYGPQKGLTRNEVNEQRLAFEAWGVRLRAWRVDCGLEPISLDLAGGGAAGGLGYALACCGARVVGGAQCVARLAGLSAQLGGAGVVVVGEGRMDRTSFEGKVAHVVTRQARRQGVPRVIALVGTARQLPPPPEGPDLVVEAGEPTLEAFLAAIQRLGDLLVKSS